MRAYLSTLQQYWRRHLGIGIALFIVVLVWSYAAQSPQYRVEGLVEIGRTPFLVNGEIGIEMVMSAAETKNLVNHLLLQDVTAKQSGIGGVDGQLGVRVNNEASLVLRVTAVSPENALQIYREALQGLSYRQGRIFQERLDYWAKVHASLTQDIVAKKKLVADLKGCADVAPGEARSRCLALLDRTMQSLEIESPRLIKLGTFLLPEHSYPTRQVGEVRSPTRPVFPDLRISLLLAFYVSLLGVASHNLMLCLLKPSSGGGR
jgi:hypothetical protein